MARFTTTGGSGDGTPGAPGTNGTNGSDGKDSLFLGTWNSVTEFLAAYQGGPVGLADGDWWAFVKDNTNPNKIYVVREDPLSATGWVIDDNEHFVLPQGQQGDPGEQGVPGTAGAGFGIFYLGNYNPSSGYVPNIAVVRGSDGQLYLAKASGQLGDPVGNTAQWEVWIPKGQDGAPGTNGADALWNYTGEYNGGASYAVGDIATYDGQLWYRYNANGGNVGDTPSPGLWNLLAAKGADGSGSADIADFVFTEVDEFESSISLPGDKRIRIEAGADSDLYITAGDDIFIETLGEGDDIHLNAADDIRFSTANDLNENPTIHSWRMDSEGKFQLPGAGYIENPIASSGDGYDYDTIKLVPDWNVLNSNNQDQYLIIDPTNPNHIHIRAGGIQDASTAHIFLGGERNNIEISDTYRTVKVNTKQDSTETTYANSNEVSNTEFVHASSADIAVGDTVRLYTGGPTYVVSVVTQEYPYAGFITITAPGLSFISGEAYVFTRDSVYNNQWEFGNDGVLSGPAMGAVRVNALLGNSEDSLIIANSNNVVLDGGFGEFLNDESASNQIATIGDLPTGATGTFTSQDNKTVTVTNGIITNIV